MHRSLVTAFTMAAFLSAAVTWSQPASVPHLPEPAGPFGIGRVSFDWTDGKRSDPFSADLRARRELMVYVWYPTPAPEENADGMYQPRAKEIDAAPGGERLRQSPIWPFVVAGVIKSHARENAPIVAGALRLPIVLFSHGDTAANSFAYTRAIEDLASRGSVVVAVEHPHSSSAVAFPDGRVVFAYDRQRLRGDRPSGIPYFDGVQIAMKDMRQLGEIEAADLRFVLDQLERLDKSAKSLLFFRRLDFSRIAAVGHSLGGMAAIRACQLDTRIKACVNQDGGTPDGVFLQYPAAKPLKQPFLFIEATPAITFTDQQLAERGITRADWDRNAQAVADAQERQFRDSLGDSYKVQVRAPGMNHMSFGDALLSATTPEARERALHNMLLTMDVTRAFLDKVLKSEAQTLLDQPNQPASEIKVEVFGARR